LPVPLTYFKEGHLFKKSVEALTLISRFWIGEHLPKFIQRKIMGLKEARGMAEHCSREYSNLAIILPELYAEFS